MKPHKSWRVIVSATLVIWAAWVYSDAFAVARVAKAQDTQTSGQAASGQGAENPTPDAKRDKSKKTKDKKADRKELAKETQTLPAVLTRDPGDPSSLNLYYGAGGKEDAPTGRENYVFVAEDMSQTQPKFDVKDDAGRRWRIKMGPEYRPETAATRLVWAAGYFVDEDYNLEEVNVDGLPKLRRGRRFEHGNTVEGVRLKLQPKDQKNIGYWNWFNNPFAGTRELNGLRVIMALMNNWDLISENNKIYDVDGQRRYVVSDLGSSFGKSGNEFTRKKGDMNAYVHSRFIAHTTADTVDFVDHSRPLPMFILPIGVFFHHPNYYFDLAGGQRVVKDIPRADARSMGQRLSLLSDEQIRDCFRAAGFSPEEVAGYAGAVENRIAQLAAL